MKQRATKTVTISIICQPRGLGAIVLKHFVIICKEKKVMRGRGQSQTERTRLLGKINPASFTDIRKTPGDSRSDKSPSAPEHHVPFQAKCRVDPKYSTPPLHPSLSSIIRPAQLQTQITFLGGMSWVSRVGSGWRPRSSPFRGRPIKL